ncbi:MAG: 3',5'-cyclic-nucleotide phosphodiesterase [bacterium]|nr:3',5'-cyclic-nucleotide phosphodiesterase [bacterium]
MKIKVIGCFGAMINGYHLSCFLVNNNILLDAGASMFLDYEDQIAIDHILITHSHLDHTVGIPFLVDTVFSRKENQIKIYGLFECLKALKDNLFSEYIWPDFTSIPISAPKLGFIPIQHLDSFFINGIKITPLRINHIVPTVAYFLEEGDKQFLYVGDMHHTDSLWEEVNKRAKDLRGVIIETSFPNKLDWLAKSSGHLTPSQLELEIKKLKEPVPIYVFHMKPMFIEELVEEIYSIKYPERIKILNQEDILEF